MNDLKVTRKVSSGNHGTIREQRRYGDKLRAVRYLKDSKGRYVKTAEIIVYERYERKNTIK